MKVFVLFIMMLLGFAAASHHQGCMFAGEVIEHGTQIKIDDNCFNCDDGVLDHCKCDSERFLIPTGTTSPPSPSSASPLETIF